ncbi:MAG: PilZ domain-containing protein [Acidobacteria bacterium]|nr:PilZ domain-containing protein [Acidobacteriota bacterium]
MDEEKRQHRRKLISRLVGIDKGNGEINFGMTGNISKGGMLMKSPYPVETRHQFTFFLGMGDNVVSVSGKAVGCKRVNGLYNVHVAFISDFPEEL